MAEAAPDGPEGNIDVLVGQLRPAEGEYLDAGLPCIGRVEVLAVRLGFTVLPAVLVLAAVPVFARYRLDPEETPA